MDEYNEDYLAHYGVIGMKWGIRHNPQKAYEKASRKRDKLNKKADKAEDKARRATAHMPSRKMRWNKIGIATYDKKVRKINEAQGKAARARIKADKWMKAMDKAFENTYLSDI